MGDRITERAQVETVVRIHLPDDYVVEFENFVGGERIVWNPETQRRFKIRAVKEIRYEIEEVT